MDKDVLDIIKENSGIKLNENTNSFDISMSQDILSKLIDEKYNNSLAYSICEVHPLKSTWGSYFSTFRKPDTTNFEIIRKDIYTQNIKIPSGFTKEVYQDLINMYGKKAPEKVANVLRGISDDQENFYVVDYIRNNSETLSVLNVDTASSGWITSQIAAKVAEAVIIMNEKSFKTLESFCLLPPKWAKYFLGTSSVILDKSAKNNSTYFVGRYGKTDFYINPIPPDRTQFNNDFNNDFENTNNNRTKDYCYVGLRDKDDIGVNSLIFAPYQYEIQEIPNPDTGSENIFLYNRFGFIENPQSDLPTGKKLLYKFEIV